MKTEKADSKYDHFIYKSSPTINTIFTNVKNYTMSLDSKFFEQVNKSMLSLKMKGTSKSRGVVWLQPQVDHIIIYFAKGEYDSNVFDVIPDGWGGYPYIKVTSKNNDMEEIGRIIKKAIEFIKPVL